MISQDIAQQRLANQQIAGGRFTRPHELVRWMGCIQADDFLGAIWAIGARIRGMTRAAVEKDFDEGKILRTHVLRPEWHFVAPDDIGWMLTLTAPVLRSANRELLRKLGVGDQLCRRCKRAIAKVLAEGRPFTRTELSDRLKAQGMHIGDIRFSALLMDAELDGIICSGHRRAGQFTYMLMEERVAGFPRPDREWALAELAKRYFFSHGPATMEDFSWWSGLPLADVKRAVGSIGQELLQEPVNGRAYWFPRTSAAGSGTSETWSSRTSATLIGTGAILPGTSDALPEVGAALLRGADPAWLLPALDEYTVAYHDKADILPAEYPRTGNNGIFKPVIVVKGRVAGIWKAAEYKDAVRIHTMPAWVPDAIAPESLHAAGSDYARFLGKRLLSEPEHPS